MGRIRALILIAALSPLLPFPPLWAADFQGEQLQKELKARDEVIRQLMQRVERLEQLVRESQEVKMVPAAVTPGATPGAKTTPGLAERLKAIEDSSVIKFFKETEITGYVAGQYNYNFQNPETDPGDNAFHVFDNQANQFVFNAELSVVKESTEDSPIGYGLTLNFGEEAQGITATGFDNDEFEPQQAYVTYKAPIGEGLDIQFGKWATLIGGEVIESPYNFNISRSFLFGFAIPFTHAGLLLSYPVHPMVSVSAGVVNGWDNIDDNNDGKSFIGRLAIAPSDQVEFLVNAIVGPEQADDGDLRWVTDVVLTATPMEQLTLAFNADYGQEDDEPGVGGDAQWWGVSMIAAYDFTEKFSAAVRGEYFRDDDGARGGSLVDTSLFGKRLDLWEVTLTLGYQLWDHVLVRAEYRHDISGGDNLFDGLSRENQDIVLFELAYIFEGT